MVDAEYTVHRSVSRLSRDVLFSINGKTEDFLFLFFVVSQSHAAFVVVLTFRERGKKEAGEGTARL